LPTASLHVRDLLKPLVEEGVQVAVGVGVILLLSVGLYFGNLPKEVCLDKVPVRVDSLEGVGHGDHIVILERARRGRGGDLRGGHGYWPQRFESAKKAMV